MTNSGMTTVTPITIATNSAGTAITVGTFPSAVAISPDQAPLAQLAVSLALVSPGQAALTATFDASASTVAFGTIATYAWNFGDGTSASTTTPTTTHTYAAAGTFTAASRRRAAVGRPPPRCSPARR